MSDYTIVVDTSCDLTAPLRERFGIEYVLRGQIYFPDGHSEPLSLDWEKMTPDEYYSSMKGHNAIYKTSSVPMGEAMEVFETILKSGKDVLSISLSSGLSSSYNETLMVAKELEAKYPDRKVVCVDSLRYSTALALLVILASKKKEEGATLDEVASYLEEIKHSVHQMGFMDDLYFLAKTGRISNAKAFFGTLVGVTPLADFTRHGLSEVPDIEDMENCMILRRANEVVFREEKLKKMIEERFPYLEVNFMESESKVYNWLAGVL